MILNAEDLHQIKVESERLVVRFNREARQPGSPEAAPVPQGSLNFVILSGLIEQLLIDWLRAVPGEAGF